MTYPHSIQSSRHSQAHSDIHNHPGNPHIQAGGSMQHDTGRALRKHRYINKWLIAHLAYIAIWAAINGWLVSYLKDPIGPNKVVKPKWKINDVV